jgi:putative ABC transport system permease protein
LAPSLGASRPDLIRAASQAGSRQSRNHPRDSAGLNVRGLLLVGQVALSIVLLIGAALLIESVSRLRGVNVGFNPANLLTMQLSAAAVRYDTNQKRATFFQELVRRVGASPGIRGATAAMFFP